MFGIRRREFVALLGGTGLLLAAKVRRARAEQPTNPVIGFLNGQPPDTFAHAAAAFREGLKELALSMGRTLQLSIAGPKVRTTACQQWRMNWSAARSR